jgi:hypothetical protein
VTLVLDASLTLASILRDETTEAAQAIMHRVVDEGAHVPSLWRRAIGNSSPRHGRAGWMSSRSDAAGLEFARFPA